MFLSSVWLCVVPPHYTFCTLCHFNTHTVKSALYSITTHPLYISVATLFVSSFGVAVGCVSASRILHSGILGRLLRAPMAFFDTTPLGRIMNRISKDMDYLDVNIPMILRQWFYAFFPLISTVSLCCKIYFHY